jgi:hypothetical protein
MEIALMLVALAALIMSVVLAIAANKIANMSIKTLF